MQHVQNIYTQGPYHQSEMKLKIRIDNKNKLQSSESWNVAQHQRHSSAEVCLDEAYICQVWWV